MYVIDPELGGHQVARQVACARFVDDPQFPDTAKENAVIGWTANRNQIVHRDREGGVLPLPWRQHECGRKIPGRGAGPVKRSESKPHGKRGETKILKIHLDRCDPLPDIITSPLP